MVIKGLSPLEGDPKDAIREINLATADRMVRGLVPMLGIY